MNTILKRAPHLKEVVFEDAIRTSGWEPVKRFGLACANLRLLDIKDLREVKEIEVKTKSQSREVTVIRGERDIQIEMNDCD